ncbi:hypothetical protein GWO43_16085 [candidate division KSB1 bacterium]|nr:hypothetical protein [candidate division KSB1 bacterium]NIV68753.1 hypothetical protein [Phycisphaerae bacterium]NIS25470.1 hypothetical protein [candidate division KSB1 bacterium]NIT72363.1 hypothetical protein [candidate division KSB1 bacterium]NIU26147.1 hypothetical protein [candidate division KSB1 bacterium]
MKLSEIRKAVNGFLASALALAGAMGFVDADQLNAIEQGGVAVGAASIIGYIIWQFKNEE